MTPDRQRTGIGSRLALAGLDHAREAGIEGVFVLGAPPDCARFGFDPALARGLASPYAGPHLMALGLDGGLPASRGRIAYAPAFGRMG